jgi:hypothetical protein
MDQLSLELSKRAVTLSNRFDMGESSPVKVKFSFTKTKRPTTRCANKSSGLQSEASQHISEMLGAVLRHQ